MRSFLSKVIADILKKKIPLEELTLVLPSQRSCVFLKEELQKQHLRATFLPQIISIEDFIEEISNVTSADYTRLLFEFYTVYKEQIPQQHQESFATFSQWATIALNDFSEIDSHLVAADAIFSTLYDVKRLQQWFKDKPVGKMATNHLKFFERLHLLYQKLNNRLENQGVGYQGFGYKKAVKNLSEYIQNTKGQTIFIGFNALNRAEEVVFQEFLLQKKGFVYWDAHKEWMQTQNEAGFFLRKYKKEWNYYQKNPFTFIEKNLTKPQIEVVGTAKNIGQAKYVGELLTEVSHPKGTAWVLADENILPIALQSIPKNIEYLNITMGYPLKELPLAQFFQLIFQLHLQRQHKNSKAYYYKNVIEILQHPYTIKVLPKAKKIANHILKNNQLFVLEKDLIDEEELLSIIFSSYKNSEELIKRFLALIEPLVTNTKGVEQEFVYRFLEVFTELQNLHSKYGYLEDLKIMSVFFNQILSNEKIAFRGEPLSGLQVMGMLETRAIDFSTVIITSVNEGVLPKGKKENSFLPFDVKKHFKMPTYQEKDAIFSYHFQRLLQRADKVYLLYNTETDSYGSGEKSRFLTRMLFENEAINHSVLATKNKIVTQTPKSVEKTPELLERLRIIFEEEGISASALSSYMYNPMTFYKQRVLGIKEQGAIEEVIALHTMGSVIHSILEEVYQPFINVVLKEKDIIAMKKQILPLQEKYVEKYFPNRDVTLGKNKLIFEVTHHYITRFLNQELKLLKSGSKLVVKSTEKVLEAKLTIENIDFPIKIKGIVDRIDELNNTLRIVDYKTGRVQKSELNLYDMEALIPNQKTKAIQVMLYAYLYNANFPECTTLKAGVFSFKNLASGFLSANFSKPRVQEDNEITAERIMDFIALVKGLITEILNPEIPFVENINDPFAK